MKKFTSFLHHLARLLEAIDKEVSQYWYNFFHKEQDR